MIQKFLILILFSVNICNPWGQFLGLKLNKNVPFSSNKDIRQKIQQKSRKWSKISSVCPGNPWGWYLLVPPPPPLVQPHLCWRRPFRWKTNKSEMPFLFSLEWLLYCPSQCSHLHNRCCVVINKKMKNTNHPTIRYLTVNIYCIIWYLHNLYNCIRIKVSLADCANFILVQSNPTISIAF